MHSSCQALVMDHIIGTSSPRANQVLSTRQLQQDRAEWSLPAALLTVEKINTIILKELFDLIQCLELSWEMFSDKKGLEGPKMKNSVNLIWKTDREEKKNSARKREVKNFFFGEQSDQIFVGASKWFLTHAAKFDNSHGDHQ